MRLLKKTVAAALGIAHFAEAWPLFDSFTKVLAKREQIQVPEGCAPPGDWVMNDVVGSLKDFDRNPFCETRWPHEHIYITGLNCYADDKGIYGLQFTYSNSDIGPLRGSTTDTPQILDLKPGETIRSAILYGTGEGDGLGHIHMQTSSKTFDCGKSTTGIKPYEEIVGGTGGGLLLGAWGFMDKDGRNVKAVSFMYLNTEIDYIEIHNVTYDPKLEGSDKGLKKQLLASTVFTNNATNGPQQIGNGTFSFAGEQKRVTARRFNQATSQAFGTQTKFELSGEFMGIGPKLSQGFQWEKKDQTENEVETREEITLRWEQQGANLPGKSTLVQAMVMSGNISVPYTSDVTIHMKDGTTRDYKENGQTDQVLYSTAFIEMRNAMQNVTEGQLVDADNQSPDGASPLSQPAGGPDVDGGGGQPPEPNTQLGQGSNGRQPQPRAIGKAFSNSTMLNANSTDANPKNNTPVDSGRGAALSTEDANNTTTPVPLPNDSSPLKANETESAPLAGAGGAATAAGGDDDDGGDDADNESEDDGSNEERSITAGGGGTNSTRVDDNAANSNNTGKGNEGTGNIGNNNIGDYNMGDNNVGNHNRGDNNRGNWNVGNNNYGSYNRGNNFKGDNNNGPGNAADSSSSSSSSSTRSSSNRGNSNDESPTSGTPGPGSFELPPSV